MGFGFLLLAAPGCRTSGKDSPGVTLVSGHAGDVWKQLLDIRRKSQGTRTLARVRVRNGSERRSFRARFAADAQGAGEVSVLTPLGTTALLLHEAQGRITLLNELDRTFWQGDRRELSASIPILKAAAEIGLFDLANLIAGLPVTGNDVSCRAENEIPLLCSTGPLTYAVGDKGLQRVAFAADPPIVISYAPPIFPPSTLSIVTEDGATEITVEIVSTEMGGKPLQAPSIDPSFRCCFLPRAIPPS